MKTGATASRSAAWIAPKQSGSTLWLEVVAITLLALFAAGVINPGNPLTLDLAFPWIWLVPVLLALRYGVLAGLGSSVILLVTWFIPGFSGISPEFPAEYFLGGLILVLGAGQFSDIWRGRLARVREVNNYLDQRLESLTRNHHILKISYDKLEQDLLAKPVTLRSSLSRLRRLTLKEGDCSPLREAQGLMQVLVQTNQLEKASLFIELNGRVHPKPVASVGGGNGLNLRDPMVILALECNELCHVQTETLREAKSKYLVAAPVVDASGKRLGLLVVEKMPFLCLNKEALQVMNVTLGYYADMISVSPGSREICRSMPGCPAPFAEELLRLERIHGECGIDSTLVVFNFDLDEKSRKLVFAETERQARRLDISWHIRTAQSSTVITILPLYDQTAAAGYVSRMENRLPAILGKNSFLESGIRPFIAPIGAQPAAALLSGILEKFHAQ